MRNLKQYMLLVRLPNIFTTPSNIFAGYFSIIGSNDFNFVHISLLVASSALLYTYGIVLNDYYDIEIDRLERSSRPLPSGKIPKRIGLGLAIVSLIVGNVIASFVSVTSLLVSAVLSFMIFAYDHSIKRSRFGPMTMSTTRFLNILLGATPALYPGAWQSNYQHAGAESIPLGNMLFAAGSMFVYIYAITLLSRIEVGRHPKQAYYQAIRQSFALIIAVVTGTILFALSREAIEMSISIILFSFTAYYALKNAIAARARQQPQLLQNAIRILLLSIAILDSIFITAFAGIYYAFFALVLIAPSIVLARKLYVT